MFKRLFAHNDIQRVFLDCKIDRSHQPIETKRITDLAARYFTNSSPQTSHRSSDKKTQKTNHSLTNSYVDEGVSIQSKNNPKRQELMDMILKKIRSQNDIVCLKGLMVAHSVMKKTKDVIFLSLLQKQLDKFIEDGVGQHNIVTVNPEIKLIKQKEHYIKKHIIGSYCQYLKKYLTCFETYSFSENYVRGFISADHNLIELINEGFAIMNLIGYILQTQESFNKFGRYYIQHKQILSLFLMYLGDMLFYNAYLKEVADLSVRTVKISDNYELKHRFLFVTQALKISDKLYQFFYNRYYYADVKKMLSIPTFLSLQNKEYKELVKYVKTRNQELVTAVKCCKYDSSTRSQSTRKSQGNETEDNVCKTELFSNDKKEQMTMIQFIGDKLNCNQMVRRVSRSDNKTKSLMKV